MVPLINSTVSSCVPAESIALAKFIMLYLTCKCSPACVCMYGDACLLVLSWCNKRFLSESIGVGSGGGGAQGTRAPQHLIFETHAHCTWTILSIAQAT